MNFFRVYFLKISFFIFILFVSLNTICFANNDLPENKIKPDNYLLGMAVRKTFTDDYAIKMRFNNSTKQKYILRELGHNAYVLILPQVRSVIGEDDIYFENEHDDLNIVFSEKKDLKNPSNFSTQINFKTKNNSFLRIQALAESSKLSDSPQIEVQKKEKKPFPIWLLYFIAAFFFVGFAVFVFGKREENGNCTEQNSIVEMSESEYQSNTNEEETSNIKNDITADNETEIEQKSEVAVNEQTFDGITNKHLENAAVLTFQSSISERFRNRNSEKMFENLIFIDKESFLETISPLKNIPADAKETDNSKTKYDRLITSFKNTLKNAHKITDENFIPEITDYFAISDETGFCLVSYGLKISFVGYIKEKVFLIKTFAPEELTDDTLFMDFCTELNNAKTYSVILNNFKALIRVTDTNISLIEDYTE